MTGPTGCTGPFWVTLRHPDLLRAASLLSERPQPAPTDLEGGLSTVILDILVGPSIEKDPSTRLLVVSGTR